MTTPIPTDILPFTQFKINKGMITSLSFKDGTEVDCSGNVEVAVFLGKTGFDGQTRYDFKTCINGQPCGAMMLKPEDMEKNPFQMELLPPDSPLRVDCEATGISQQVNFLNALQQNSALLESNPTLAVQNMMSQLMGGSAQGAMNQMAGLMGAFGSVGGMGNQPSEASQEDKAEEEDENPLSEILKAMGIDEEEFEALEALDDDLTNLTDPTET